MHGVDAGSVEDPPRKRYKQQDLGPWLLSATKDELDDAVADFFYGTGTPLHISRYLLPSASASTDRTLPFASCSPNAMITEFPRTTYCAGTLSSRTC